MTRPHLLCFGFGYTARTLAERLGGDWQVTGTSRDAGAAEPGMRRFGRAHPLPPEAFAAVTHILVSVPPDEIGDPVLDVHAADIAALSNLAWLGYLSTTGVYGDRGGAWVDESSELRPTGLRGKRRVGAEAGWLGLARGPGVPVHVFRLAGIYGPGRSAFDTLRAGTAKRIDKPGQFFSRIHVDDIAGILAASIARPRAGAVYNACDDEPAPPAAVVEHAAHLLGMPAPPLVSFDRAELSPMARSFYDDNRRVSNALVKRELGCVLHHPNYRVGLAAILAAGG